MSQIEGLNVSDSDLNASRMNPDISLGQFYWKGKKKKERKNIEYLYQLDPHVSN